MEEREGTENPIDSSQSLVHYLEELKRPRFTKLTENEKVDLYVCGRCKIIVIGKKGRQDHFRKGCCFVNYNTEEAYQALQTEEWERYKDMTATYICSCGVILTRFESREHETCREHDYFLKKIHDCISPTLIQCFCGAYTTLQGYQNHTNEELHIGNVVKLHELKGEGACLGQYRLPEFDLEYEHLVNEIRNVGRRQNWTSSQFVYIEPRSVYQLMSPQKLEKTKEYYYRLFRKLAQGDKIAENPKFEDWLIGSVGYFLYGHGGRNDLTAFLNQRLRHTKLVNMEKESERCRKLLKLHQGLKIYTDGPNRTQVPDPPEQRTIQVISEIKVDRNASFTRLNDRMHSPLTSKRYHSVRCRVQTNSQDIDYYQNPNLVPLPNRKATANQIQQVNNMKKERDIIIKQLEKTKNKVKDLNKQLSALRDKTGKKILNEQELIEKLRFCQENHKKYDQMKKKLLWYQQVHEPKVTQCQNLHTQKTTLTTQLDQLKKKHAELEKTFANASTELVNLKNDQQARKTRGETKENFEKLLADCYMMMKFIEELPEKSPLESNQPNVEKTLKEMIEAARIYVKSLKTKIRDLQTENQQVETLQNTIRQLQEKVKKSQKPLEQAGLLNQTQSNKEVSTRSQSQTKKYIKQLQSKLGKEIANNYAQTGKYQAVIRTFNKQMEQMTNFIVKKKSKNNRSRKIDVDETQAEPPAEFDLNWFVERNNKRVKELAVSLPKKQKKQQPKKDPQIEINDYTNSNQVVLQPQPQQELQPLGQQDDKIPKPGQVVDLDEDENVAAQHIINNKDKEKPKSEKSNKKQPKKDEKRPDKASANVQNIGSPGNSGSKPKDSSKDKKQSKDPLKSSEKPKSKPLDKPQTPQKPPSSQKLSEVNDANLVEVLSDGQGNNNQDPNTDPMDKYKRPRQQNSSPESLQEIKNPKKHLKMDVNEHQDAGFLSLKQFTECPQKRKEAMLKVWCNRRYGRFVTSQMSYADLFEMYVQWLSMVDENFGPYQQVQNLPRDNIMSQQAYLQSICNWYRLHHNHTEQDIDVMCEKFFQVYPK